MSTKIVLVGAGSAMFGLGAVGFALGSMDVRFDLTGYIRKPGNASR